MNLTRHANPGLLSRLSQLRPQVLLAAIALLAALPATAAEFSYRYYQFKTTKVIGNANDIQLSELSFFHLGEPLNLNDKDLSGTNVVTVSATSGTQDPMANEGTHRLFDGNVATKWFRSAARNAGNELVIDFGVTPPTVDAYGFSSAGDSNAYYRTPQSWELYGSNDKVTWNIIDGKADTITSRAANTAYGPYELPAIVPPLITALSTPVSIVLNGTPVTFTYETKYSTERNVYAVPDTFPLVTESGTLTVTPPANSPAAPYTFVATKDGSPPAVKTPLIRTVIGGASTYQYVRFIITKRRGGVGDDRVQLAEFEFYNSAVSPDKIPISFVENPGGDNGGGDAEVVAKLIDGITTNKWLDFNNAPVVFDFGSPQTFDQYAFFTANDSDDRDAIQWTMEGSNDLERWDLIENVDFDYATPLARQVSTTPIPLPGPSLPPRIEFFTASALTLIQGETLTFNWSTQATSSVEITPAPGDDLPVYGSATDTPTVDTVYTLTAYPLEGSISDPLTQTITVTVVEDPGLEEITYDDFADAGTELVKVGSTTITPPDSELPGRLRLTPDEPGQNGSAWFLNKLDTSNGFEVNFGLSMHSQPTNAPPADGIAFVIHNSDGGNSVNGSEEGLPAKALNITFKTFGWNASDASRVQVTLDGFTFGSAAAYTTPGVELYGVPGADAEGNPTPTGGFPYTLATLASDPPYRIRVVYVPGDLDVYIDGIALIQNASVNLTNDGAADENGKSYFGFTSRTGGNSQFNDITDWSVKFGDFTEVHPFGMVKTVFKYAPDGTKPAEVDLVWNADEEATYQVYSSPDLATWTQLKTFTTGAGQSVDTESGTIIGLNGQIGAKVAIPAEGDAKLFYRVGRTPLVIPD